MLFQIIIFMSISSAIYFALSTIRIIIGKPKKRSSTAKSLSFNELGFDHSGLPEIR